MKILKNKRAEMDYLIKFILWAIFIGLALWGLLAAIKYIKGLVK